MSFLREVETAILAQLSVIEGAAVGLAGAARPAFITGLVIWITLTGYEVAFGKTQEGVAYLLTKLGKMCLIGWLALWAWPDVSSLLSGLKDSALGAGGAAGAIETAVLDPLATTWSNMWGWFQQTVVSLNWYQLPSYFSTLVAYTFMLIGFLVLALLAGAMAAASFGMFMIAQVVFSLHLAVGAFFLLCLMFPFTQRFFETYIGSAMTSIFALVLTSIVLNLGASVLGLNTALGLVSAPPSTLDGFAAFARDIAILFLAKAGAAALLIYMFFKIWDLAAALGGGINMGNNLIGGVRGVLSDLSSKGGKSGATSGNSMSSGGGASGGASSRAQAANAGGGFTFTGAALRGGASSANGAATGILKVANAASSGAAAVGRFAYNRYSQNRNRVSAS